MSDELLRCPEDTDLDYYRSFCENVFRKSGRHYWCRRCSHFAATAEDASQAPLQEPTTTRKTGDSDV